MRHLLLLLALCALACERRPESQAPLVIGFVGSLTGPQATFGTVTRDGALLAIDEFNASGGLKGRRVELRAYDSQGRVEESVSAARRLIGQDKVLLILGEVTSAGTLAIADMAQAAQVPVVTPSATHPEVTEKGDYLFRACFTDTFQARAMARFARESLKLERVALLQDDKSAYSTGLARAFSEAFSALGGTIVATGSYAEGDTDFRAPLTQLRQAQPQALYVPGFYNEVGVLARQARELGLTLTLLGSDGWESQRLVELAGDALEGSYFTTHFAPDSPSPELQRFLAAYKARYGQLPDSGAALGHDAARIALSALQRAEQLTGPSIREALARTRDLPGALGRVSFDEKRNPRKPAFILRVQGSAHRFAASVLP